MGKKELVWVLVPLRLSDGVVKAQLFDFFDDFKELDVQYCTLRNDINRENIRKYKTFKKLKKDLKDKQPDYIYLRSITEYPLIWWVCLFGDTKVIYSFRSFLFAESYFRNRSLLSAVVLFIMELFAYFSAHKITAVSKVLQEKCKDFFIFRRAMLITPCYCNEKFVWNESKTNADTINFVYVGGVSKWQCIGEMLELYQYLFLKNENIRLTIYTPDSESFTPFMTGISLYCSATINFKSVQRQELLRDLPRYDIGFLLRENILVNQVASPIKFYEYVGAGVVPLITPYIGDISRDESVVDMSLIYDFSQASKEDLALKLKEFKKEQLRSLNKLKTFNNNNKIEVSRKDFVDMLRTDF